MCVIPSMAACCCCVSELLSSATATWLRSFGTASGLFAAELEMFSFEVQAA